MTHLKFASTLFAAGALGLLLPATASAQETCSEPFVDFGRICDDGDTGPRQKNTLAGCYEQGIAAYDTGSGTVASVYMSAKRQEGFDAPYQCNMSTWTVDATQGPMMAVTDKLLTQNDGDRPCNHPILKDVDDSVAPAAFIFGYGSTDVNNNNVDLFAEMRDLDGNKISNRVILSNPNGSNDGAGDCTAVAGTPNKWMCCYNQNGDTTECSGFRIEATPGGNNPYQLVKEFEQREVLAPTNIDRDKLVPGPTPGTVVNTIAYGDQRPPEYGSVALVIDYEAARNGNDNDQEDYRTMSYIMRSEPDANPRMYANSPEVALGPVIEGTQYYYIMNTTTDGDGKNGNDKGQSNNYLHLAYFDANNNIQLMSTQSNAGAWLTHSGLCSGTFGANGEMSAVIASASVTGTGPASLQPFGMDSEGKLVAGPNIVTTALGADSGHLANIYGNNPNNQGRDFTNCIGGIPNPGYGIEGAYQPGVENFFFSTVGGRMADDLNGKNAGWFTFVPGTTPGCTLGEDPTPDPNSGDDDVDPEPEPEDDDSSDTPDPQEPQTQSPGTFGGCSLAGSGPAGSTGLVLILGALVFGLRRRRD